METSIIILAAGSSSRMGKPKQLLGYQGTTLVQHAIHAAMNSRAAKTAVVLGFEAEKIGMELEPHDKVLQVINDHWQMGMSSSIRAGLSSLLGLVPPPEAVIITVCDQPFVDAGVFNELIEKQETTGKPIVACRYAGTIGTPALFLAEFFPELLNLEADAGAKKIILSQAAQTATIDFPLGNIDIDRPTDYEALQSIPATHKN